MCSVMSDSLATPWTVALQAPQSMGFFQARILAWVAIPPPRDQARRWLLFTQRLLCRLSSESLAHSLGDSWVSHRDQVRR